MKSMWKEWSKMLLLVVALVFVVPATGCAGRSTERTIVSGLYTATLTIEQLEDLWGDYVVAGKATQEQRQRVEDAHEKYRRAKALARAAILGMDHGRRGDIQGVLDALIDAQNKFYNTVTKEMR